MDWDVAVVGAGPAGSTIARLLASAGLRVVVVERCPLPRYKACGGGLTGRSLALLPREVFPIVRVWSQQATVSYGGRLSVARSPRPSVGLVLRSEMDALLTDLAVQAGAALMAGAAVTAAVREKDGVRLSVGGNVLRVRYVVAADGSTGVFQGPMGAAVGLGPCAPRIGAVEAEVADPSGSWGPNLRGDFDVVPGGYGWVFPKGDVLSIGVASWRSGVGGHQLRMSLSRYMDGLGMRDREVLSLHGHPIPVGGRLEPRALYSACALRIGDAAGLADPLFGEGIAYALESAHLAAPVLVSALHGDGGANALRPYAQALDRQVYRMFRVASALARTFYRSPGPWIRVARSHASIGDLAWRWATAAARVPADGEGVDTAR